MSEEQDEKKTSSSMTEILSGIKIVDPRPTDLQVFFQILPHILGGWASKSPDIRGANSSGFIQAREALGQLAMMGVLRAGFVCNDRSHLAILPQGAGAPLGQPAMTSMPSVQGQPMANASPGVAPQGGGGMVQQYPTQGYGAQGQPAPPAGQPMGGGGMVQQYPTYNPQNVQPGGGAGGAPMFGDGSKGVLIAQFPNSTPPVPPPGPPIPPPF
jgi:hypothetical protein